MIQCNGVGRLVADPELKELSIGDSTTQLCTFTLAINEFRRKDGETIQNTHFFDFKAWDTGGKALAEKAKKGDEVFFWASPRQEKWQDKESGQNRSKVTFRLNKFKVFNRIVNEKSDDDNSKDNDFEDDGNAPF